MLCMQTCAAWPMHMRATLPPFKRSIAMAACPVHKSLCHEGGDNIKGKTYFFAAGGELELPPCAFEDRWVQLSATERAVYERTRAQLESAVAHAGLGRGRVRYATAAKRKQCALPSPLLIFLMPPTSTVFAFLGPSTGIHLHNHPPTLMCPRTAIAYLPMPYFDH